MRPRKFREVNRQHSGKNVSNRLWIHRAPGVGLQEVAEKKMYSTCFLDDKQEIGSSMTCHL